MGSHLWADWGSWVHAWPCGCPSLPPKWAAHRKGRGQRCRPGPRPERSDERSAKTARVQRDGRQRGGIGRVWGPRRTLELASELPRPAEAPRGRESHCDSVAGGGDLHRSCPLCHAGMSSLVVLHPPSRLCRGPRGRSPSVASVRSQPVGRAERITPETAWRDRGQLGARSFRAHGVTRLAGEGSRGGSGLKPLSIWRGGFGGSQGLTPYWRHVHVAPRLCGPKDVKEQRQWHCPRDTRTTSGVPQGCPVPSDAGRLC